MSPLADAMRFVNDQRANQLPRMEIGEDTPEVGRGGQLGRQVEEARPRRRRAKVRHDGAAIGSRGLRVDGGARNGFGLKRERQRGSGRKERNEGFGRKEAEF